MTDTVPQSRLPRTGTLVLIAVVLLVGGGALMVWLPYHRNQTAIVEVERLGGTTASEIVRPFWVPDAIDDEYLIVFERIDYVALTNTQVRDSDLRLVRTLSNLQVLSLGNTQLRGSGLKHLNNLPIRILYLNDTQIIDAGFEHLRGLSSLQSLMLDNTQVSDAGLEHLHGLTNLEEVWLLDTPVTKDGVEKLKKALPNCDIMWEPPHWRVPRHRKTKRTH